MPGHGIVVVNTDTETILGRKLKTSRSGMVLVHPETAYELFGGLRPIINSLVERSSQTDIVAILFDLHNFRISAETPPCQLENDQSSACTGYLSDGGPEKASIQPPSPTSMLFGGDLTTLVSLPIGTIVFPYDLRRRLIVFDHSIQDRK